MIKLCKKSVNIIIATHTYTTGPAHDLRDYLIKNKIKNLLFVSHPLFYDQKIQGSGFELYHGGTICKKKYENNTKQTVFSYIKHTFNTILWTVKTGQKWDIFIGSNNLNALSGIVLKKIGYVDKTIYYTIDYDPNRFKSKFLNYVYHFIDKFCVKYSDVTWNLSPRMEDARKKFFNLSGGNQVTMPIGIWYNRIPRKKYAEVEKTTLVFMGHILKKSGVQSVIEAIPYVIKKIPKFKFLVIGGGEYLPNLIALSEKLHLEKYIEFTGYIKDHKDIEQRLSRCAAAIAMYKKWEKKGKINCTYFADPGKVKSYLGAGLPILISDVPHNAKDIAKKGCGLIIKDNPVSISKGIINILNDKYIKLYKVNALKYAKEYDWNIIFGENLNKIICGK